MGFEGGEVALWVPDELGDSFEGVFVGRFEATGYCVVGWDELVGDEEEVVGGVNGEATHWLR